VRPFATAAVSFRENAIYKNAWPLLAALSLALSAFAADAARAEDLPRIRVDSGRIEIDRRDIPGLPEISMYTQQPSVALTAPESPGRRTVVEATVAGEGTETFFGFQPRLRLGYGRGDGASSVSGYSDVFIRGVLIKEFN